MGVGAQTDDAWNHPAAVHEREMDMRKLEQKLSERFDNIHHAGSQKPWRNRCWWSTTKWRKLSKDAKRGDNDSEYYEALVTLKKFVHQDE